MTLELLSSTGGARLLALEGEHQASTPHHPPPAIFNENMQVQNGCKQTQTPAHTAEAHVALPIILTSVRFDV